MVVSLHIHRRGFCRKVRFWGKIQKSGIRNSTTYRLPNSRKSNFATEPERSVAVHPLLLASPAQQQRGEGGPYARQAPKGHGRADQAGLAAVETGNEGGHAAALGRTTGMWCGLRACVVPSPLAPLTPPMSIDPHGSRTPGREAPEPLVPRLLTLPAVPGAWRRGGPCRCGRRVPRPLRQRHRRDRPHAG